MEAGRQDAPPRSGDLARADKAAPPSSGNLARPVWSGAWTMSPVRPLRGSQEDATRGFSERPRGVVDRAGLRPRVRFWGETAVAVVCGVLAIATVFWQDWIEALTGFDPDHHGGSAEWLIVAG